MAANLEVLYEQIEGTSHAIGDALGSLDAGLAAFSNQTRALQPLLEEFTKNARESWFSLPPNMRTSTVGIWQYMATLVTTMELTKEKARESLAPDIYRVYAKDIERFAGGVRELGNLLNSYLAREGKANNLASESTEEAAAVREALSGDINLLPGRTYTAEEFKQRFG